MNTALNLRVSLAMELVVKLDKIDLVVVVVVVVPHTCKTGFVDEPS